MSWVNCGSNGSMIFKGLWFYGIYPHTTGKGPIVRTIYLATAGPAW